MTIKKIKVSVTEADIENGKAKRCVFCPVALACARALGVEYVTVTDTSLYDEAGVTLFARLSCEVKAFISRFDSGGICQPFTFTLEVWEQS